MHYPRLDVARIPLQTEECNSLRRRVFTSTLAALALFAVVGLVAALAPSIAWPNLARAHSLGGATLTALTVIAVGRAQTLSPTFSSTVAAC